MAIANAIIAVSDAGWVATYEGGAHIEISHRSAPGRVLDTANVWDYEADKRSIPFTIEAINARFVEWIAECAAAVEAHVLTYVR